MFLNITIYKKKLKLYTRNDSKKGIVLRVLFSRKISFFDKAL